ncbi:MAG: hypothetical protein NT096_01675 [Proteobacteria bacterium]|nr:hypothetical protein [Pseudomonadota bacterium]
MKQYRFIFIVTIFITLTIFHSPNSFPQEETKQEAKPATQETKPAYQIIPAGPISPDSVMSSVEEGRFFIFDKIKNFISWFEVIKNGVIR